MQGYEVPNTDNKFLITKNFKYNYLKYRTLLHFVYLNKDSFKVENKEVKPNDDDVWQTCGRTVYKVLNMHFRVPKWKPIWDQLSKDDVFAYHVEKMSATPDPVGFLNKIIPCGIVYLMNGMMLLTSTLRKCSDDLKEQMSKENPSEEIVKNHQVLNDWIKNLETQNAETLVIPDAIYQLAQEYTDEGAIDLKESINEILKSFGNLMQPYLWATLIEVICKLPIVLPHYEPNPTLSETIAYQKGTREVSQSNSVTKSNSRKKSQEKSNKVTSKSKSSQRRSIRQLEQIRVTRAEERQMKQKKAKKLKRQKVMIEERRKRIASERKVMKEKRKRDKVHLDHTGKTLFGLEDIRSVISIPLIPGMEFSCESFYMKIPAAYGQLHSHSCNQEQNSDVDSQHDGDSDETEVEDDITACETKSGVPFSVLIKPNLGPKKKKTKFSKGTGRT